jgi:hypothetical protein
VAEVYHASTTRHTEWGGPKRWIRIVVHEDNRTFQAAAAKYSPNADWDGTAGAFHPTAHRERWDKHSKEWVPTGDPYFAGVMRLSREQFTNETIVHECLHAAIAIYRSNVKAKVNLGDEVGDNEEHLCYILGDLTEAVFAALKEE